MAVKSFGTLIKYASTTVGEIQTVSLDGVEIELVDSTHMESTNGWRTFITTVKNAGTISFSAHLLADSPTTIYAQLGTTQTWSIVFTTADTFSCSGILTTFTVDEATIDGKQVVSGTVKLTGEPSWA